MATDSLPRAAAAAPSPRAAVALTSATVGVSAVRLSPPTALPAPPLTGPAGRRRARPLLDVSRIPGLEAEQAGLSDVVSPRLGRVPDVPVSGGPTASDLAVSAPQTSASARVRRLAAELGTPTRVFEYCRNRLVFEPYFGAVKGADQALAEMAGNDVDIASALISLLRALGVPCRYVYGTIRLSPVQAAAWLGVGSEQVPELLVRNGIPHRVATTDGSGDVLLDHVWVRACLEYLPYRGAVPAPDPGAGSAGPGAAWIELDASFKQHRFSLRRDIEADLGLQTSVFLTNVRQGSSRGSIPGHPSLATGSGPGPSDDHLVALPEALIHGEVLDLAETLSARLARQGLGLDTVFQERRVIEEAYGLLPCTDLYPVAARGGAWASFPAALSASVSLRLTTGEGQPVLEADLPVAALVDGALTLSYRPATAADQTLAEDWLRQGRADPFPACLLRVRAGLDLNGVRLAEATRTDLLGGPYRCTWQFRPAGTDPAVFPDVDHSQTTLAVDTLPAGALTAFVFAAGQVTEAQISAAAAALGPDAAAATAAPALLRAIGLSYFYQADRFSRITANVLDQYPRREPSLIRVSWGIEVETRLGQPNTATARTIHACVTRDAFTLSPLLPPEVSRMTASQADAVFRATQALTSSALAWNSLEQTLGSDGTGSISAVRLLHLAIHDGTPVVTLAAATTAGDADAPAVDDAALAGRDLDLDPPARAAIVEHLNRGYVTAFPLAAVAGVDSTAVPLLAMDPVSGECELLFSTAGRPGFVGGSQAVVPEAAVSVADLLVGPGPAVPARVAMSVTDWLTALPDSTASTGTAYLPTIAHIKNLLLADSPPPTAVPAWCLGPSALRLGTAIVALLGPLAEISQRPGLVGVVAGPSFVSPNGDGRQDVFAISATATRTTTWTIRVVDATGGLVRELSPADNRSPYTGQARTLAVEWDGTDAAGALVPDGAYQCLITAQGAPGTGTASATVGTVLDSRAPRAELRLTRRETNGQTSFAFSGTADDANLDAWGLELREPETDLAQLVLATGATPVIDAGFLVAKAEALPNGSYLGVLTVTDRAGNRAVARTAETVVVRNPVPDVLPPVVTLTGLEPSLPTRLLTGSVAVRVTASDPGGVAQIAVKVDGTVMAAVTDQAELAFSLDCTTIADGLHNLRVEARDRSGNAAVPVEIEFLSSRLDLDLTPPTLEVVLPDTTADLPGPVALVVAAADNVELRAITAILDGSELARETLGAGERSGRLATALVPEVFAEGTHTLRVVAEDTAGNRAERELVAPVAGDAALPQVSVETNLDPQAAAHTGDLTVVIAASDDGGVRQILPFLDDRRLDPVTAPVAPARLALRIPARDLPDGAHRFVARVVDTAGRWAESDPVGFTSSNPIVDFAVTPRTVEPGLPTGTTLVVSARLNQARPWRLRFSGPSPVPDQTGTEPAVRGTVDAAALVDADYTVTLSVQGVTAEPTTGFTVNLVTGPPVAAITSLGSGPVPLKSARLITEGLWELAGTADDPDPQDAVSWKVVLLAPGGREVAPLTPPPLTGAGYHEGRVVQSSFGVLDFTRIPNGLYDLVLSVRGGDAESSASVRIALDSQLKVGQFRFSEPDVVIPVSGLPLSVVRSYDSLEATAAEPVATDLGPGWSLAVADVRLELDEDRETVTDTDDVPFSMRSGGGRNVSLTLPDGRRAAFVFSLNPAAFGFLAEWTPAPGVRATLEPIGGRKLVTLPFLDPYWEVTGPETPWEAYDFPGFVLTTRDGTRYVIEREDLGEHFCLDEYGSDSFVHAYGKGTLRRIEERSGARTVFRGDGSGIDCYNAAGIRTKSVVFRRDAQQRLSRVYDAAALAPNGAPVEPATLIYAYDADGNLAQVQRLVSTAGPAPVYRTTEYRYEDPAFPHYLTSIAKPDGTQPLRLEYDAGGRLVATTDALGNRAELTHDLADRTETVYDRLGNPTTYLYDARGNVTVTIDALGNRTVRSFDTAGNVTAISDPLGSRTRFSYDATGNCTTVTDALGAVTRMSYNEFGQVTAITDPLGNTTRFLRDPRGRTTTRIDALGQRTDYSYDAACGLLTSYTDPGGNHHLYDLSQYPRVIGCSLTDPGGRQLLAWTEEYDGNGCRRRMSTERTTAGGVPEALEQTFDYDREGRLLRFAANVGLSQTAVYDVDGNCIASTDANGRTISYEYDARGLRTKAVLAPGQQITYTYDAEGRPLTTTSDGVTSRQVYDAVGRVVKSIQAAGTAEETIRSYRYDAAGRLVEESDGQRWQLYQHDACGRLVRRSDWTGQDVTSTYDAAGNLLTTLTGLGFEARLEYDSVGRRVGVTTNTGAAAGFGFDAAGRPVVEVDAAGNRLERRYDAAANLTGIARRDADGNVLASAACEYDELGLARSRTDALGHAATFGYDLGGRLTSANLPGQERLTWRYEGNRLSEATDGSGQTVAMRYDEYGRLAALAATDAAGQTETRSFEYEPATHQVRCTDRRGVTTLQTDDLGRLVAVQDPVAGTVRYTYSAGGLCTSVRSPNHRVEYAYDEYGRVQAVTADGRTATRSYDASGRVEAIAYPNGLVRCHDYDAQSRTLRVSYLDSRTQDTIAWYATTFDASGRRTAAADSSGIDASFAYTPAGQLRSESHTNARTGFRRSTEYAYDAAGNRTELRCDGQVTRYTYEPDSDRLRSVRTPDGDTRAFVYDGAGRLASVTAPADTRTFTYDAWGRLSQVRVTRTGPPETAADITTAYEYDAMGNRVRAERRVSDARGERTETQTFLYDLVTGAVPRPIEIQGAAGAPPARFTRGLGLLWYTDPQAGTDLTPLVDTLGSIRQVLDPGLAPVGQADYDAFGNLLPPGSELPALFGYRGELIDPATGLYYLRARDYDPATGRFTSPDPLDGDVEFPETLNRYVYALGDPLGNTDPTGMFTLPEFSVSSSIATSLRYSHGAAVRRVGDRIIERSFALGTQLNALTREKTLNNATMIVHGVQVIMNDVGWSNGFSQGLMDLGVTNQDFWEHRWSGFCWSGPGAVADFFFALYSFSTSILRWWQVVLAAGGGTFFSARHNVNVIDAIATESLTRCLEIMRSQGYTRENVIGHSWGTFLSHRSLRNTSGRANVFVTMGSPLGANAAISLRPAGVATWMNVYSTFDLVCTACPRLAMVTFIRGNTGDVWGGPLYDVKDIGLVKVQLDVTGPPPSFGSWNVGYSIREHLAYWTKPAVLNQIRDRLTPPEQP